MLRKLALLHFVVASLLYGPRPAWAADDALERPVPRERSALSVRSGRTLSEGETTVFAGVGWPGLYVGGLLSPSDGFDLGFRGRLLAGSPIMGFPFALGFDFAIPLRVRILRSGRTDLALVADPYALIGRSALVGAQGPDSDDFGYGVGVEGGLRVGHHVHSKLTIFWGVLGSADFLGMPTFDRTDLAGTISGVIGIESLITRATLVFFEAQVGYGFAPEALFDRNVIVQGSIGFAHNRYH